MPKEQSRPGKARKADVFAKTSTGREPMASYLKRIRKWKEGGMEGPKPSRNG